MYALVATVTVTNVPAAREALAAMRLDIVPRAPGFVSACWLEPVDGIDMSVIIFQTRDKLSGLPPTRRQPCPESPRERSNSAKSTPARNHCTGRNQHV